MSKLYTEMKVKAKNERKTKEKQKEYKHFKWIFCETTLDIYISLQVRVSFTTIVTEFNGMKICRRS